MRLDDLTSAQYADYLDTLLSSHSVRSSLEVYDMDENLVERYDASDLAILDGQVDVDDANPIKRQLSLSLANTRDEIVDPRNPGSAVSPQRILHANYEVLVGWTAGGADWVEVPVFHGPVTRVERDSFQVNLEGQSKEAFLLPPSRLNRSVVPDENEDEKALESYYAGALIRKIARRHGETMIRVPRTSRRIPEDAKMFDVASREAGAWPLMQRLAGQQQLLYTADGYLTMRGRRNRNPSYVWRDGARGNVIDYPRTDWDMKTARNTLELRAFERKRGKETENPSLRVTVHLHPQHDLSPQSLARGERPRELLAVVTTDDVYTSKLAARRDAKRMLDRIAYESVLATFNGLPVPHLEPGDLNVLEVDGHGRHLFTVKAFSVGLVPSPMAMGYTRKVTPYRRRP